MQTILIKQRDLTDCGAACLSSVATFHKLRLPVSRIRQYASTDKKGTNILGLITAANRIGFDARGVRGEFESLFKIPKPTIAHVVTKNGSHHYVVIYKATTKYIEVMDPSEGAMQRHTHEEFKTIWTGALVLLWPNQQFEPGNKSKSLITRFLSLLDPHKYSMFQILVGALIYTLIGLSSSIYIQKVVDHVLIDGNQNLLNLMSSGMIALLLFQVFIGSTKNIFTLQTGQWIDIQLILGYYKHLLKLPQSFFDSMRVGEIISRFNDAVKIRSFVNEALTSIALNIFILIFSFVLMFAYHWKLALIIVLIIPFYCSIYLISNYWNKKVERRVMENTAELESQLIESLNSVKTIKSFALEASANSKTELRFLSLLKNVYASGLNSIFTLSSSEFVSRLFTIILIWTGAGFVINHELTPGELLSFYALVGYFTGPVNSLLGLNKVVQNAIIAADRLFEIMDLEQESDENKISLTPEMLGKISFKEVSFRYGSRTTVLENFSLDIPIGKITAVVGESGSGKSTLIALLQNLYTIQSGQICIGDYNLKYISTQSIRNMIGIVPQKIDLFAGNVLDNIALGTTDPDMKEVFKICSALGILEFIEKLPNGFSTYLGENGASLSGGQKQRIAIARALYKQPAILILDEASASLDSVSEIYLKKTIEMLRLENKTVIIIAHRLSSVIHADKIVVIDQGKVAEEGSHQVLIQNRKKYYELWKNQFHFMEEVAC